jgi:EpsD family peptidyl-prolyl cis-trans isomerase
MPLPTSALALRVSRAVVVACAVTLPVWGLVACGGEQKDEKKPATQSAARVNKEEITVHQINFVLAQQRGLKPEQTEAAGKQALERLIDQEVALQKATEQKFDRDPRVLQQLEAARREIVARAYFEKVAAGAPKATQEEVQAYYDANPALFKERRVYQLQELAIQIAPDRVDALRAQLTASKNIAEFVQYLQKNEIKFVGNQAVRAAEQLPFASLSAFAAMKDGQAVLTPTPDGAQVVVLAGSRSQPVDVERAKPAIEQYLLNERKRKLLADDVKALRSAAQIKYLGKYAEGAPAAAPVVVPPTPAEVAASAAKALDEASIKSGFGLKDNPSATKARESAPIAEPAAPSASSVDLNSLNKGVGGLK